MEGMYNYTKAFSKVVILLVTKRAYYGVRCKSGLHSIQMLDLGEKVIAQSKKELNMAQCYKTFTAVTCECL
jgi:hypothetical protein